MRDITAHPGRGRGYIVNLYLNLNRCFKNQRSGNLTTRIMPIGYFGKHCQIISISYLDVSKMEKVSSYLKLK